MERQDYSPFRQKILSRDELRDLSTLRPWVPVRDIVINWALILAAWALVALYPQWWSVALAFVVVGTSYYALLIIGHDGLHRRLMKPASANDLLNDVCIVGPIGAITRINRENHMEHHQVTSLPNDPDRHKYVHDGKEPTIPFLLFVAGLASFRKTIVNVFFRKAGRRTHRDEAAPAEPSQYRKSDVALLVGWQAGILIGLTLAIGWWAYFVLWALPVYLFAYRGDLVRVFCEHSMLTDDPTADQARRMISYESNWLERRFFAPHNMNNHIAHHLWPSIPYYNLPKAEMKVREWVAKNDAGHTAIWRSSYVGYLVSYYRWRLATKANAAAKHA